MVKRPEQDTSPKKTHSWQISIWKDAQHYVIRESWIKWDTTAHWLEWPKIKTVTTPNADKDTEQQECSPWLVGMQYTVQPLWKMAWRFLTKLQSYDPAITLLDIYPKELKTYIHTNTCTLTFTAALFITANTWKQARCASVSELINKLKMDIQH